MNRAQRRAQARSQSRLPNWLPPGKEARVKRLMQQGISPEDLEREYRFGHHRYAALATLRQRKRWLSLVASLP